MVLNYLFMKVVETLFCKRKINNIFFLTELGNEISFKNGELATFIKIDNIVNNNFETYQLLSISKRQPIEL